MVNLQNKGRGCLCISFVPVYAPPLLLPPSLPPSCCISYPLTWPPCHGRFSAVFCNRREHGEWLAGKLTAAAFPAAHISGSRPQEERTSAMDAVRCLAMWIGAARARDAACRARKGRRKGGRQGQLREGRVRGRDSEHRRPACTASGQDPHLTLPSFSLVCLLHPLAEQTPRLPTSGDSSAESSSPQTLQHVAWTSSMSTWSSTSISPMRSAGNPSQLPPPSRRSPLPRPPLLPTPRFVVPLSRLLPPSPSPTLSLAPPASRPFWQSNMITDILRMPHQAATLLHRIGRTGRWGTFGVAVTYCTNEEELKQLRQYISEVAPRLLAVGSTVRYPFFLPPPPSPSTGMFCKMRAMLFTLQHPHP